MEQARRLGDELAKRGANPADVCQAIESSGIPRIPAGSLKLRRDGVNLMSTVGSLHSHLHWTVHFHYRPKFRQGMMGECVPRGQ
jgi:hypothetical protein